MKWKQAWKRFQEFGGLRLMWQYTRMGLWWQAVNALLKGLVREKSVKAAYALFLPSVEQRLKEQYGHVMHECKARSTNTADSGKDQVPHIVWTCWLQGEEQAPALVRQCVASQKAAFPGYEHRVLTFSNYRQWASLPEELECKYRHGLIPAALFSDLLRLAVLLKYGGIWMDAMLLCTGMGDKWLQKRWQRVMESPMTLFRYFHPQTKEVIGVSNWFIATKPGNMALESVYEMLLAYWHDYDCTVDYYMMHLFLEMSQHDFPELWNGMPRMSSHNALLLGSALERTYVEKDWQELTGHVALHKLNYRKADDALKQKASYCEWLLGLKF